MAEAPAAPGTALCAEVEELLFREAALLDRREFSAWLALYSEDCLYWIPSVRDDADPAREVSIVYDDRRLLGERVWRLESGLAYAQEPASRTAHLVGNVTVSAPGDDGLVGVESVLVVTEFRRAAQRVYAGRCLHRLRREGDALAIAFKKVELIDNDGHIGNLSILL